MSAKKNSAKKNQRRSPRIVTENLPGMAFSVGAEILNVSRGGLAISTSHQLRIGNRYQIQIGEKDHSVEAKGTVTRCRLKGTRKDPETGDVEPAYQAGIKFEPELSEKAHELLLVMARTVSIQLSPRLFGRFSAQPDSADTLDFELEFEVKKISLSGLLAESVGPPWAGDLVNLELSLGDESFTSAGQIVNTKAIHGDDENEERTQYGVEFLDREESDFQRLESFVLEQLKEGF